jgi:DNA-binding transcriptional LysR family regulator
MTLDPHRRAMDLVEEAERLAAEGLLEAARETYEEAAKLEEQAADAAGEDQPRTRGILRVSAVSTWRLARVPSRAAALARRYLAEPLTPGFAREIYEMLAEIDLPAGW